MVAWVVHVSVICSVEVGISKGPTCPITISCARRVWPEKAGELLASMYLFGTLNRLKAMPNEISIVTYGILALRMTGCLVVRMELNRSGCSVQLLHEGGIRSLGAAIQLVVAHLKAP